MPRALCLPIVIPAIARGSSELPPHERSIFFWRPGFNINSPAFDNLNQPYVRRRYNEILPTQRRASGKIQSLIDGNWVGNFYHDEILKHFRADGFKIVASTPKTNAGLAPRIAFDRDNWAYTIVEVGLKRDANDVSEQPAEKLLLLYSKDLTRTWQVLELPRGSTAFGMETPHSPEPLEGPPAISLWKRQGTVLPGDRGWMGNYGDLRLVIPLKTQEGTLRLQEASELATSLAYGPGMVTTKNKKTYLLWPEAVTVQDMRDGKGSPNKIRVFDHSKPNSTGWSWTSDPRVLHASYPANDGHAQPRMVMDSRGRIHVVTGGHNTHFYYLVSEESESITRWSKPIPTLWKQDPNEKICSKDQPGNNHDGVPIDKAENLPFLGGCQTYLSMVRDEHDTLHAVFRQGRIDRNQQHRSRSYMALSYQQKPRLGDWSAAKVLVVPPFESYWNYHHSLVIDRSRGGRLFLSYTHSDTSNDDRNSAPYEDVPMYKLSSMISSQDLGETWDLVTAETFMSGMRRH